MCSLASSFGIKGIEFDWFCDYLSRCKQRVVVDGHSSEWAHVTQGVPQGSILGPLLFLLYVNDLPAVVAECTMSLYADDVTIYYANKYEGRDSEVLNADLQQVATWIEVNRLRMNITKTQLMILGGRLKSSGINVSLNGTAIPKSDSVNYLGVTIDQDLNWKLHVASIHRKAFAALASIHKASSCLPVKTRKMLYLSLVLPYLDYCSTVWHSSCSQALSNSVEQVQNYAMGVILHQPPRTPSAPLRQQLGWTTLWQQRHRHMLCQVHKCVLQTAPPPHTLQANLQRIQPFTHQHVERTSVT